LEKTSNYEKLCEQWRLKFLEMNVRSLVDTVPGLELTEGYLTIVHFGRRFGLRTDTGHILALDDDRPVSIYTRLNIYTLLGYAAPGARIKNEWVTFSELKDAGPFAKAFQQSIVGPLALTFEGKPEAFEMACRALGGIRLPSSGLSYQISAFDCIPMRFLFWDGDEEFPAQANVLFDRSATDFIHVESTVTIAGEGLYYLAEAAGLELKGSPLLRP
jgi:hypothetical protein